MGFFFLAFCATPGSAIRSNFPIKSAHLNYPLIVATGYDLHFQSRVLNRLSRVNHAKCFGVLNGQVENVLASAAQVDADVYEVLLPEKPHGAPPKQIEMN